MRRILLLLAVGLAVAAPAALAKPFPETVPLPNGWLPEGIAIKGNTFYAGSRANGAIYRGDLRTGAGSVFIQGAAGRAATGLKVAHGLLFVSGAGTGKSFVYDLKTGALVREYQLATGAGATFINDVVVTNDAAYFTDSNRPVIYKVSLGKKHEPAATAATISLTGDYQHVAGFNLNGIDATPNGKTLVAVQTATGKLFTIDTTTGATALIDTGSVTFTNGDGILLQGKTLYVVQNSNNRIAVVKLSPDLSHGTLQRYITDSDFDVPTTIARHGNSLYAVNARFTTPPTPSTTYTVVKVRR
jgi:sugar lactone lactonase YvrE